jgi:hypothetical protein
MDSISAIGVLLAAVSAMVVGSIYYSPATFLKPWQKMTGTTDADMKKNFGPAMILMFVAALLTAYILAHFMLYAERYTGTTGIMGGLSTAFWVWLGFSLTTIITSGALETRDRMVMVITAGNRLVTLLVMGIILGLFMK